MSARVFQFKITMKDIDPPIWRRILVPEKYSFWDLHVAIQDAMGWLDYHLHLFKIRYERENDVDLIGIPDEDPFEGEPETLPGWEIPISDFFRELGKVAEYEYDFGDGWRHEVLFEGMLLKEKNKKYPKCIGGARACPPEDCGGVGGYYRLLEIFADSSNEEYEEMVSWLGKKYDADDFDAGKVKFENPKKRWKIAFLEGQ